MKISKGEYIGFVDNDDWISKDYFEVLYINAKKTNADISATSNVIFPEQNRKKDVGITRNGIIKSIKDKSKIIITSGVIWNKIYKREMLTKNHIYFSTRRCIGEDNNFNIFTIILSNFIVTTDKVSYFWSQHHNSRNHAKRTEQDLLLLDNYRDILNKLSDLEIPSQQKEEWNTTINERMRLDFGYLLRDSDEDLKKKVLQKIEKYQDYNIKPDIQISQDKYSTKAMQINSFNIQKSLPQLENKFKVSIIMPTYNRAFIIKRAINSILNQTFSNYELIICDDGSTDNTEELLKRDYARYFKSGKFIYLKLEHYGVSKARNMGLKRSNGDLVAYLDSDNLWKPEFLEKMVGLFDSNPKFKSAYCALQVYDQVKNKYFVLNSPYNRNKILMGNYIDLNVFIHRRELYELFGGFNETLERLVDWDLILRYTKKDDPLFLDEILAQYYIHKKFDNISLKSNFEEQRKKVYDIHSNEIINTASSNTNFITDPRVTLLYLESENPINFPNYLKVGVFIDGELKSLGSCPYIRLYSPFEHLSVKKNFKIFIYGRDDISKLDMHKIMKCKLFDAIIIQRGVVDLETAKIILKKCKENKIKVIYESDDDLLSIEESNRNYPHLKKRIEAMDYLIKNSDLLTVSTDALSERFNNASETLVVRNYLVKELQPIKNIKTQQDDTKSIDIGYFGTLTHDDDLFMIEEPVRNIITKFKEKYDINVNFYIIGGMNKKHEESWFSKIEIPENATAFVSFMEWLRNNAKFDIMIAPLKDTIFNSAKSELKYIEYTALGIPGIYSDLPPYNSVVEDGLNGLLAKNNKDWEVKLEKLILDHNLRIKIVENAQKHIKESYLLEHRAEQWETIIQNITEKGNGIKEKRIVNRKVKGVIFISGFRGMTDKYRITNVVDSLKNDKSINIKQFSLLNITLEDIEKQFIKSDYNVVFCHRVDVNERLKKILEIANRKDMLVIYDTDDLLYDESFAKQHSEVRKTSLEQAWVIVNGHLKSVECFDHVTCTTSPLKSKLIELGIKNVEVLENTFSDELFNVSNAVYNSKLSKDYKKDVIIGYPSGSPTHDSDFKTVVPVLERILSEFSNVKIHLIGEINQPPEFERFSHQIVKKPFVHWAALPEVLAEMDINITPLRNNAFCNSKSAIKYIEAALVRVPTVASATKPYKKAIENGVTGFVANDTKDWYKHLKFLIDNKEKRVEIGEAAFEDVKDKYNSKVKRDRFLEIIESWL